MPEGAAKQGMQRIVMLAGANAAECYVLCGVSCKVICLRIQCGAPQQVSNPGQLSVEPSGRPMRGGAAAVRRQPLLCQADVAQGFFWRTRERGERNIANVVSRLHSFGRGVIRTQSEIPITLKKRGSHL